MLEKIRNKFYILLKKSEKYTKTDMIYLSKGGFWLTLGQLMSSASAFFLAVAFANLLPKETYGIYKYILSIASILSIPTLTGINDALVRSVARGYDGSFIPALKTKIRWGLLGGLSAIILSGYYFFNGNFVLTYLFLITSIFLPFMDSLNAYGAVLNGKKLFKISAKYEVIKQIASTLIMVAILVIAKNIYLVILSYFIMHTSLRFIFLMATLKKVKLNNEIDDSTISYGKHLSLISLLRKLVENLDKILLWHFMGAAQLAVYFFAIAIPNQLRSFMNLIIPLSLPKLAAGEVNIIKKTLPPKIKKLFFLVALIVILYIFFAPLMYKTFFPQYIESIKYSQLYALVLLFFPRNLMTSTLVSHAKKKNLYFLSNSTQIIKLILLFSLVPFFKITGVIYTEILINLYSAVVVGYFFKKMD